jgi:hypothetical protein
MPHSIACVCGHVRSHKPCRQVEIMIVALLSMSVLPIVCESSTMYDVLGLEPSATAQDIKKSFRGLLLRSCSHLNSMLTGLGIFLPIPVIDLALKWHPDKWFSEGGPFEGLTPEEVSDDDRERVRSPLPFFSLTLRKRKNVETAVR